MSGRIHSRSQSTHTVVSTQAENYSIWSVDPKLLEVSNKGFVSLLQKPKDLFTFGNDFYMLDNSGTLTKTNVLHANRLCGMNTLLSDVVFTISNKYCVLALKQDGNLFALGSDDIKIGILGLGISTKKSMTFQQLIIQEKIKTVSLADTYAVALSETDEMYIWGTTQEKFFGDGINTTHFVPTKLTFSAELSIHRIFAHSEALYLLLESNEMECITRFHNESKSSASGYRLPRIAEGRVSAVAPFGRFVALLTATGCVFVYHHHTRELSYLGDGYIQMSSNKNRLVLFEHGYSRIHVLTVPIYSSVNLSNIHRRTIQLSGCDEGLLLHQPRLDPCIIILSWIGQGQSQFVKAQEIVGYATPVNRGEVALPGNNSIGGASGGKPPEVLTCGVNSRTVLFEESYIRMRYKEIKEMKRQEDNIRISGLEKFHAGKERREFEPDQKSELSKDTSMRIRAGGMLGNSKLSSYDEQATSLPAGVKQVSSGPLQGVTESHFIIEGSRSDARVDKRKPEVRNESDFDEISNYSQTGRSGSRASNKINISQQQIGHEMIPNHDAPVCTVFDAFHTRYFSKRFTEISNTNRAKDVVKNDSMHQELPHPKKQASKLENVYTRLQNRRQIQTQPQGPSQSFRIGKHSIGQIPKDSSSSSQIARSERSNQRHNPNPSASETMLISDQYDNMQSLQTIPVRESADSSPKENLEGKNSRAENAKYKKADEGTLLERDRTMSRDSVKSKSRSSRSSTFRRSQERFQAPPVEQPKVEKIPSGKALHQNSSAGALASRNSFNFSLSHQNSPSAYVSSNLMQLRDQLNQEQKKMTELGVTRAPLNSTECLTMSISSMGATYPLVQVQQNLLKSPTEGNYQQGKTIRTLLGGDVQNFGVLSDQNFLSATNLHPIIHPEYVPSIESLPIRSLVQSQCPSPEGLIKDVNVKSRLVSEFAILESLAEEQDENSTIQAQASKKDSNSRIGLSSGLLAAPTKQTFKDLIGLDDLYSPDPTHRETDRLLPAKGNSWREHEMAEKCYEIGAYGIPEYKKSSGTATPFRDFEGSSNAPCSISNEINRTIKGETPMMTAYQGISNTNSQSKDLQVDIIPAFPKITQVMVTQFQQPSQEQSQIELQPPNYAFTKVVAGGLEALSPHLKLALQTEASFLPNTKVTTPYGSQTVHHSSSPGLLNTANIEVDLNSSSLKTYNKNSKDTQSPMARGIGHKSEESVLLGQSHSQPNPLFATAVFGGGPHTLLEQIQHTHSSLSSKTSHNNSVQKVEIKLQSGWRLAEENGFNAVDSNMNMPKDTMHSTAPIPQISQMEVEAPRVSSADSKNRHKGGNCCAKPVNEDYNHLKTSHDVVAAAGLLSANKSQLEVLDDQGPQMVLETGYYDPRKRRTVHSAQKQDSKDRSMISSKSRDSSKSRAAHTNRLNRSRGQKSVDPPPYQHRVLPKPPSEIPYKNSLNKLKGLCNKDNIEPGRTRSGGARSSVASGGSRQNSMDNSFNFIRNSKASNIISRTDDSALRTKLTAEPKQREVQQFKLDSKLNSPVGILNSVKKIVQSSVIGSRSQSRKKADSKQDEKSGGDRTEGDNTPVVITSPLSQSVKKQSIETAKPSMTQLSASKKKISLLRAHAKKTIQEAKMRDHQWKKLTEDSQTSKSGFYIPDGASLEPTGTKNKIQHNHHYSLKTDSVVSTNMQQHPAKDLVRIWQVVYMRRMREAFATIIELREHRKAVRTLQTVIDLKSDLKRLKSQISAKTSVTSSAEKVSPHDNRSFELESQAGSCTEKASRSQLNRSSHNRSGVSSKDKQSTKTVSPIKEVPKSTDGSIRGESKDLASATKKQSQNKVATKTHPTGLRIDTTGSNSKGMMSSSGITGVKIALLEHFNCVSNIAARPASEAPIAQSSSTPLFGWEDLHIQKKYYEPGVFKLCIIQND